jgi:hypothetical protein
MVIVKRRRAMKSKGSKQNVGGSISLRLLLNLMLLLSGSVGLAFLLNAVRVNSTQAAVPDAVVGTMHHHINGEDGGCGEPVPFRYGTTKFDVSPGLLCSLSSITINPGFGHLVRIAVDPRGPSFTGNLAGIHNMTDFNYNDLGKGVTVDEGLLGPRR